MNYIVLQEVRGRADRDDMGDFIQFTWRLPVWEHPLNFVSIIPRDKSLIAETIRLSQFTGNATGYKYRLRGRKQVSRLEFLLLATDAKIAPDQARRMEKAYCPVLVGEAIVHYEAKVQCQGSLDRVDLQVRSSGEIAEWVLGYTYVCGGVPIRYPLPGIIKKGMNHYPSVYVPAGERVAVVYLDSADRGLVDIRPEQGKFGQWLSKLARN